MTTKSSTLNFSYSLRQSADPVQAYNFMEDIPLSEITNRAILFVKGLVLCKKSGKYITYDESAMRLWSSKSQIKSLRLKIDDTLAFHCMEYILEIKSIVVIFSVKKKSSEKGGAIFIVDESLTFLQEIPLKHSMIRKVSISPEQKHIAVLDSRDIITISRLDASGIRKEDIKKSKRRRRLTKFMTYDDEDSTSSDEEAPRKKGGKEIYNPVKAIVTYLKLVETQTIQLESSSNPKDIIITNTTTMAVLDDISIHVYSRDSGTVIDKALKKVENTEDVPFVLLSLVTIKLGMFNPFKRPKLIRAVDISTFIVGFNDGSFQILSVAALMTSEESTNLNILQSIEADSKAKNAATILCEFQAHSIRSNIFRGNSTDGILDATLAPWKCLQSGNVYTAEFFTVGDDKRLVHWGLRIEDLTEEEIAADPLIADNLAPAYKFKADILGEFQLKYEPPSHISTKFKNDGIAPMKSHFIAFELACLDSPIRKKLVCSNGGMLIILDIMQPYRVLGKDLTDDIKAVNSKSKLAINDISTTNLNAIILSVCRGPTLLSAQDADNILDESDISCESTVLLLKKDVVEIVSILSGSVVQQFSTLNLRDYVYSSIRTGRKTKYVQDKIVSSHLANGIALKEELNELEGQPSVAHWCNLSRLIVIGYSLGGVGIIGLTGVINSDVKKPPYSYLMTTKIHGSEITLLTTFNHTLTVKGVEKPIIACLVGDSNGVISLWQIYPASTKHSPILSSSQRHPGKVLFAHTCLLEPNASKRILVTACSAGTVKAWKVQEDGELLLMASFRSEKAKLTSVSLVPIITQEKIAEGDDGMDDDAMSVSSQSTLTKQTSIQSAASESKENSSAQKPALRTEYEIHCVCGFSNGVIENWLISSNQKHSYNYPVHVYQENKVSVSKIIRVPQLSDNYVNTQNFNESIFCPFEDVDLAFNQGYFLVAFSDGCQSSLILSKNGTLRRRNYFVMPSKVNFILAGYNTLPFEDSKHNLECLLISDLRVHEVLVNCVDSSYVSDKWKPPTKAPLLAVQSGNAPTDQEQKVSMMYERRRNPTEMADSEHFDQAEQESSKTSENFGAALQDNDNDGDQSRKSEDTSSESTPMSRKSSDSEMDIIQISPRAPNAVGYSNTQSPAAATAAISMSKSSNESQSKSKEYVGNMESSQRIISTELHFAKKDRKLLELFLKKDLGANGSVSAADAVEIVFSWLNSVKVARESIWELLKLLEIKDVDRLKFIEVAKIAAVVSSALNKTLQEMGEKMDGKKSKRTRLRNYQSLKSYTTKVTYNSMGEKVVEKVPLQLETMGIYDGFVTTIRRIWDEENCRVITQSESRNLLVKPLDIRLQQIPAEFKNIFGGQKLDLPISWLPAKNTHWFDPLRVIRIARTLLDMRSSLQHAITPIGMDRNHIHYSNHKNQVLRMEAILVQYFERNYGNKDLHVTPLKVVNFLEACLQYQHHPIVNIIQAMLRIEPDNFNLPPALFETAIWICTEARSALCARGSVIEGAFMQPYNSDFNYMESFVKDGAVWQVRWQLVRRADAISITDEILRLRGGYGPAMYLQIFGAIESIPWIKNDSFSSGIADQPIGSVNPGLNDQLIDLECFLEVLFYEFLQYESMAYDSEQNVFGEGAMALAVNVEKRDINNSSTSRRKFIIDDQDFQYGFFHDSNMAKIKLLMLEFIRCDPLRTGILEQSTFEKVLRECGIPLFTKGKDDGITEVQVRAFLRVVHKMFLEGTPAAPVSYIDLCAALLGWEFQCQGDREVTFAILSKDIAEMKRSIEQAYANELVRFFSSVQLLENIAFYSIADPIWVVLPVSKPSAQTDDSGRSTFTLPTKGDWVVNTSPPDDIAANPFFTDALTYSMKGLALGKPAVVADKMNRSNKLDVHIKDAVPHPKVLATNRFLRTIHGEIIESGFSSKPVEKCPLSKSIITLDIPMFEHIQPTAKEVALDLSRQSFSRGVSEVVDKSSFISDGVTYTHRDNQPPNVDKSISILECRPQQSLVSDGSIVVQLRSLLPATYSPPDSKGIHPHVSIKENELANSDQHREEHYSAAPSPLRSLGTPHRLSKHTKSSLFSFSTSTDRPSQTLADMVDPLLYSNSLLESVTDINNGAMNDNKDSALLNYSQVVGDKKFDGDAYLSRPTTRGHSSSAVFLSANGGVGVSAFYGGSISTEDSMVESLAREEAQNRLNRLKERDEDFEKLFQNEREEFEKRDKEKRLLQKQIRRELKAKERESMKIYYEAIEDKYRVAMKGKEQLDAALALEDEDKKQREREIQAILERNKERSLQLQEQKIALKKAEEERDKQFAESSIMVKEDKLSALVRKELAIAAKAEKEREAKLLQQEMEERMKASSLLQSTVESELAQESAVNLLNSESLLSDSFYKSAEESVDRKSDSPVPSRVPSPELVESADHDEGADAADEDGEVFDDEDEAEEAEDGDAEPIGSVSPRSTDEDDTVDVVESVASPIKSPHSIQVDVDQATDVIKTEAEKRLDAFIEKLQNSFYANSHHPRRKEKDNVFFIPLTFSGDISFNPFATEAQSNPTNKTDSRNNFHPSENVKYESSVISTASSAVNPAAFPANNIESGDGNESSRIDPFADIKRAVKGYRKDLEKQRNLLYSLNDMTPADFLRIYRRGVVKWNDFFMQEKRKELALRQQENENEEIATVTDDEDDPLPAVVTNDDDSVDSSIASVDKRKDRKGLNKSSALPSSFNEIPDIRTAIITPMPTAKVLRKQRLHASEYKYYQIENVDKNGILTVEMNCKKGSADMYLSKGYLPSSSIFEFEAHSKAESTITRLTAELPLPGTFMLCVHAPSANCKYSIWCCITKENVRQETAAIATVNKLLIKFDILSQHDPKVLEIHFPRLYQEAGEMSETEMASIFETADHRRSVINEMKQLGAQNSSVIQSMKSEEEEDDDEIERDNIDRFVTKVGRYAMKKERALIKQAKKSRGKVRVDYLFNIRDPNLHGDLFNEPQLHALGEDVDGVERDMDAQNNDDWDEDLSDGDSGSNALKTRIMGPDSSFLDVFKTVQKGGRKEHPDLRRLRISSSSHVLSVSSGDNSEPPPLKLPPINTAATNGVTRNSLSRKSQTQTPKQKQMLNSYSHLSFDLGPPGDTFYNNDKSGAEAKKKLRKAIKDPLLSKVSGPISYKLSKF